MTKALVLIADQFEDLELFVPYYRFLEEGLPVVVAAPATGKVRGMHGYEIAPDLTLTEVVPTEYSLLLLPGGKAPRILRADAAALEAARHFFREGKPVGAICHGPQTLVSAGVLRGRRATAHPSVAGELREAGAVYEDREVVVDGNLVTSRRPPDLPAFMREIHRLLQLPARA